MNQPLRILQLEDNPTDAELIAHSLRKSGLQFESLRVDLRDTFIAALDEFQPDLVLADYSLPGFDGLQALAIVRERQPLLPFIFVTGSMGEERAVESLHHGADDYILKDRISRLPVAVSRTLDEAAQRMRLQQSERDLRLSESRFRDLVETSSDWIWEVDAQGRYTYASPQVLDLLGYAAEEVLGRTPFDLMPADEAARVGALFSHIAAERRPFALLENVCLHKDGHIVDIETSGTPRFDESGVFLGYHGVDRDITERKQSEAKLELKARLAQALLELPGAADELDEVRFMQRGQELAEELTGSQIAFIHFVNDDQETIELVAWSRRTLESYCQASSDRHYPVSQAGIWADALRQRAPVMVNDYAMATGKHGLPEGHAHLERLISVPVIEGGLVRMMTGVGNKAVPYTDLDVETVQLISNEIWRIVCQRRAERALRENAVRLSSILRASPVGIGVVLNRVFTEVNDTVLRMTGYSRDELIGRSSRILYPSDAEFERVGRDTHAQIREHGLGTVETVWLRKDGTIIDVYLSSAVTDLGDSGKGVTFSAQDISRRKATETQLRKLAQAVEQSPESIAITDLNANLEYVNEAFVQNTGYSREEVIGQNPRILHSGQTPKATYESLWAAMTQGQPWKGEFLNQRKDGSEYVEFAIITPLRQADGRITHYVAVKEDITEKKRVAAELDQHRLHLQELVDQRTLQLKAAQEEAERLSQVKSEFLANMSHEIRTPLNAVLGFAQVGQRNCEDPQAHENFDRILDAGQLLLHVVNDILDFSKIEAGKLQIEQGRMRPGELLDRCAGLVRALVANKGLELRIEQAADLPASCAGDELRISQVLMNLLTNAIKFTERGQVTLSAARDHERIVFRVADTGIGMTAQEQSHLFLPFEQADSSTTRRFGGTGLGLAISKRLLDLMGGQIEVSSQAGQGSVFQISLPLRQAEGLAGQRQAEAECSAPEPIGQRLQGVSILVAEDNPVNRMVLEELLASEGCRLTQVENGQLAVDRVRSDGVQAFDVVLMDIQMPVLDGIAATREIKAFAPDLPIIGLTAHALVEERENCLAAGMAEHVAKPIELADLLRAIREQVSGIREPDPVAASSAPGQSAATSGYAIDWPALERRYQGNMGFLIQLLNTIVEHNSDKPDAIRAAIERHDFGHLARITHSLKGMAGDVLPNRIRDLAGLTEAAARKEEEPAFGHAAILASRLGDFLDQIRAYLGRDANASSGIEMVAESYAPAELDALLERLSALLRRSDASVNALQAQSAGMLRHAFGQQADQFGREIQAFDYELALESLSRLVERRRANLTEGGVLGVGQALSLPRSEQ